MNFLISRTRFQPRTLLVFGLVRALFRDEPHENDDTVRVGFGRQMIMDRGMRSKRGMFHFVCILCDVPSRHTRRRLSTPETRIARKNWRLIYQNPATTGLRRHQSPQLSTLHGHQEPIPLLRDHLTCSAHFFLHSNCILYSALSSVSLVSHDGIIKSGAAAWDEAM